MTCIIISCNTHFLGISGRDVQHGVSDVDAGVVVGQLDEVLRVVVRRVAALRAVGRGAAVARLGLPDHALVLTRLRAG